MPVSHCLDEGYLWEEHDLNISCGVTLKIIEAALTRIIVIRIAENDGEIKRATSPKYTLNFVDKRGLVHRIRRRK